MQLKQANFGRAFPYPLLTLDMCSNGSKVAEWQRHGSCCAVSLPQFLLRPFSTGTEAIYTIGIYGKLSSLSWAQTEASKMKKYFPISTQDIVDISPNAKLEGIGKCNEDCLTALCVPFFLSHLPQQFNVRRKQRESFKSNFQYVFFELSLCRDSLGLDLMFQVAGTR